MRIKWNLCLNIKTLLCRLRILNLVLKDFVSLFRYVAFIIIERGLLKQYLTKSNGGNLPIPVMPYNERKYSEMRQSV